MDRIVEHRSARGVQPLFAHPHVVVGEHDDGGVGRCEPGVERVRFALSWLEKILEWNGKAADARRDDRSGLVGRIVVDDDHVPGEARGHGCTRTIQQFAEKRGAVVRAHQHSGVEHIGVANHGVSRCKAPACSSLSVGNHLLRLSLVRTILAALLFSALLPPRQRRADTTRHLRARRRRPLPSVRR